jgi:thiol:disulfide interchange protein DsbD
MVHKQLTQWAAHYRALALRTCFLLIGGCLPLQAAQAIDVLAGLPAAAAAPQDPAVVQTEQVTAQLLLDAPQGWLPGKPVRLGLKLQHAPDWHTYWRNPGDSGAPISLQWQLPAGSSAGAIDWPLPTRIPIADMVNYGYARDVVLSVPVSVKTAPPAGATIRLQAKWLVCRVECVPQQGEFALTLPPGSSASHHAEFAANLAAVPQAPKQAVSVSAQVEGDNLVLRAQGAGLRPLQGKTLTVLAEEPQFINHAASGQQIWQGGVWQWRVPLNLSLHTAPAQTHWVLSAQGAGKAGKTALRVAANMAAEDIAALKASAIYQRNTAGMTVPPALQAALEANARAQNAAAPAQPSPLPVPSPLPATPAVVAASAVPAASASSAAMAAPAAPQPNPSSTTQLNTVQPSTVQPSLLWALALALLGGALLNLMPCVFPVLALKVLGIVQAPDAAVRRRHAWVYAAGVVLSFLALAALLLALKAGGAALGWGFQLQAPGFLAALALLFTLLALSMSGGLELRQMLPQRLLGAGSQHPVLDSFLSGVLAVAVASPCTAPFMGAALGFALGQSAAAALLVFLALGVGMALPYVLLTYLPRIAAILPKPGAWMDAFKRLLALPLWLTVVWLLWVLGQQLNIDAAMLVLAGLVFAVSIIWLWFEKRYRKTAGLMALLLLLCLWLLQKELQLSFASKTAQPAVAAGVWQPWSAARQAQLQADGHAVFVDYTAAWCVTCQYNKKAVLDQPAVQAAFKAHEVQLLLADWTNYDPAITASLQQLGRSGLPVYVLIDRQGRQTLLPELLTQTKVITALQGLQASKP